ncbi:EamA family transporter [Micromonospora parathelypteridis]|uniref:Drug/metabolite transporter (DMT)-like permease n=1 Tax=Micromonospora parathelypteridis TaxID=1839617 RepID=A0A840W0A4_9ACTN|nr:EamA family transporter [Micromonospora parathelypteridis]MBB5478250.1 drug/metabolite transporter (DMT)-like permease [Micromonospora parathelypteridis]GGO07243.1 drug/metabolite exporter YedA [Micromonospora parathelypteridis]
MSSPPPSAAAAVGRRADVTPTLIWTALIVVYLLWGSTYLAIRITVETLPPLLSAALRFAVAGLILAVVLRLRRGPGALRVDRRQLASAALVGVLLLAGGNGLVVLAESGPPGVALPSGIAALLVATVPLLVVLLRAATGDRPPIWTFAGVSLGFVGLVLLVLPAGSSDAVPLVGALTVVAGAVSWSVGSFLSGRIRMPADPFVATVYEMLAGALVLAVIAAGRGELSDFHPAAVSTRSWLALVYLMVAGSLVAFTAYVWLLHNAPISLVSTYAYVNPAVAVALGALLVAEPITAQVLLGGAVIVAGVALVVSTERPRRAGAGSRSGASPVSSRR